MPFTEVMEYVTKAFELAGVAVLVVGFLWAFAKWFGTLARRDAPGPAYTALRNSIGVTILLALEVLVAADIVRTLAVDPTIQNVAVLGLIVLIRTFLSFSLEIEIDGMPPWQRAKLRMLGSTTVAASAAADEEPDPRP